MVCVLIIDDGVPFASRASISIHFCTAFAFSSLEGRWRNFGPCVFIFHIFLDIYIYIMLLTDMSDLLFMIVRYLLCSYLVVFVGR